LRSVIVRELKFLSQLLDRLCEGVLLTVTRELQQRKHQGLEVRDSHVFYLSSGGTWLLIAPKDDGWLPWQIYENARPLAEG
jgi:hypothetical protein